MISLPDNGPVLPLSNLQCNESGCVVEVLGDSEAVHRLTEMGIRCGTQLSMVRPGSPCIVGMDGKRICLRLEKGMEVLVEVACSECPSRDSSDR